MHKTRKELIEAYKSNHTPMGIYQIRNLANEKVFLGSALNLSGLLTSNRLQLCAGNHPNKQLQAEWKEFGGESFAFEVLDELAATEGPDYDYKADLAFLEEMWLEKLQPYGERGYNAKKLGREERLREMAQKRMNKS